MISKLKECLLRGLSSRDSTAVTIEPKDEKTQKTCNGNAHHEDKNERGWTEERDCVSETKYSASVSSGLAQRKMRFSSRIRMDFYAGLCSHVVRLIIH